MSPPAATLGTSILQFIDVGDNSDEKQKQQPQEQNEQEQQDQEQQDHIISATARCNLLLIPPCLLLGDEQDDKNATSILLQGPPKSGRTSIAMDLAYSIAASAPCQCPAPNYCACVAVTMFVRAQSNKDPSDDFPLICRQILPNEEPKDFEMRWKHITQEPSRTKGWEPQILKRVQVYHVSSLREVLKYLLSVQSKPLREQPSGSIIIDDLDILASSKELSSQLMTMMQTCTLISNLFIPNMLIG